MASTNDQSWERAVKQPAFDVSPQLLSNTGTSKSAAARNMRPCKTCADNHKKCNMSPPYSSGNCKLCAMARVPCPPHKGRKLRKNVTRERVVQHSPLSASASDALQPHLPSDNKVAEVIQPQNTCATGAPAINVVAETSSDDAAADAPASQLCGFDGLVFPDPSFDLFSLFASGSVDSSM